MEECAVECSINKVYLSEILDYIVDEWVQIYGGYGYHQDYPAERAYRDARINRIFEGTSEINRLVIASFLLKRAASGKLDLQSASRPILQEEAPESEPPGAGELLAEEVRLVAAAKQAALLAVSVASRKFADALPEQQEIVAAIESAVLRARKVIAQAGAERAAHSIAMACLWVHSRMYHVEQRARMVLAGCAAGDALRKQNITLQRLTQRDPVDAIGLRRQIAARVIEQGKYVV